MTPRYSEVSPMGVAILMPSVPGLRRFKASLRYLARPAVSMTGTTVTEPVTRVEPAIACAPAAGAPRGYDAAAPDVDRPSLPCRSSVLEDDRLKRHQLVAHANGATETAKRPATLGGQRGVPSVDSRQCGDQVRCRV